MSIFPGVQSVIVEKFGIDRTKITPNFSFDRDIQFKDRFLDMIDFKMDLEKEFDITIADEDFESFRTVDDVVKCIERIKP